MAKRTIAKEIQFLRDCGAPIREEMDGSELHSLAKRQSSEAFYRLYLDALGQVEKPMSHEDFMDALIGQTAMTWAVYAANQDHYDMSYVGEKLVKAFDALIKIKELGGENYAYNYSVIAKYSEISPYSNEISDDW